MRKKYLSALLFGALLFASAGTFTSCKDYDDDINNLQEQITANADAIKKLQDLVGDGKYVTAVSGDGNTITFTFNDGTTTPITVENGTTSQTLTIDPETGELLNNGEPTGIKPATDAEKAPVKAENGVWVFLNENGEYESTNIPVSGVNAVKNEKDQWVLTIYTEDGEKSITLPTAASLISEVEILGTISPNENDANKANTVEGGEIKYNFTLVGNLTDSQKEWNKETGVKQLVKNQALSTLSSKNNNLLVRIAPATVDASEFAFTLINTQLTEAPLTLGTPVAYEGLLTRAENGLWMIPASAKEGLTYENEKAYIAQFNANGSSSAEGEILFAFQEKEGFTSNYDLSFSYDKTVNLEAKVKNVNSTDVTGKTSTKQYTNTEVQAASAADVNAGKVTISFDDANAVYDAHLHFDAATVERWGIEYTEGTSFNITTQPDDVTAANFQVQVHYVDMTGAVKSEWIRLHVNKSYSEVTEYANKNVVILGDNTKNTFDASLDAMFTNLGDNLNKWKADVEGTNIYYQVYDKDSKTWKTASNMAVALDKSANQATKFTWNLADEKVAMQLGVQYRAVIEFKDKDGEILSKLIQPITFSIPSLTDLLVKEQVVFGGTVNGTAVMNEKDFTVETATTGNEESLYSLKYAFVNQLADAFANGTELTFAIDPTQTIKVDGTDTKMNTLVKVNKENSKDAYVKLLDTKHAYNQAIKMNVTAKYLGVYDYSDEEEAAAAFTIKLVSPIEQGTLTAKDGENAIITVVATDNGTAKITESDLLAKTYAGIQYKVFKDKFDNGNTATGWSSPYIASDPTFKSNNENVFTMGNVKAATKDDKGNITEGYVVVKPMNVAYEDAVPVEVTVTDKWGYTKVVTINVKVKPNVAE
ncbi:hypothetical protein QUW56_00600 [Phocaeicola barnesiae]|uniref:hypothetical protein n=1 Tax=Phocaeicola barnesiae TaxID=376804 RepID=UPI0025A425B2|nr:hypothetical protein [Phocaeicola barnesiae]MDM8231906.1 hypothetical protein [Phocaeicola barnesiae]